MVSGSVVSQVIFNKGESYVLNDPWLTFSQLTSIIEICLLNCPVHFFNRNKTDELRARGTRSTPRKTTERFLQRGVKLHCDDLDKKGTEELKRGIMCTLHLQRAHISLVSFLCIYQ